MCGGKDAVLARWAFVWDPIQAGGAPTTRIRVPIPRPALREPTIQEVVNFLRAEGQIGSPPTMDTDASPDFSRMAYQIVSVAMNLCEAGNLR